MVITPRGERLHDSVVPLREAFQKELEAMLEPREITELHRILAKLINYLSNRLEANERTEGTEAD
ncbi:hypothetical protein AS156_18785 [Bradyrhizobium macuxiense]|uniref:HTH marR-type domain-containing protein n=1 Tax=Bradyrhizobium macuxiense TaxID=1755647 RepID=A0A120FJ47_9BRAD|nr:hypothetical protein AS156_18785 [Bradyrhizobium macuxiense]